MRTPLPVTGGVTGGDRGTDPLSPLYAFLLYMKFNLSVESNSSEDNGTTS
jgi:hypothetical protein